jgi:predicted DNA-binding protein (MmcQ/YjbR family)
VNFEEVRAFCLSLPGTTETFPFEPGVSVFKAANGKMFAVCVKTSQPLAISVKCDPDLAVALRAEYASIVEGYHLNKRHWITIMLGSDCPDDRVRQLVEDSHGLVAPR